MNGRFRPVVFVGSGARWFIVVAFVIACVALALLPRHAQFLLHRLGKPVADVVAIPMESLATIDREIRDGWTHYLALQGISEQNHELRRQIQQLQGELTRLRERVLASDRIAALFEFQKQASIQMVAAKVIGRSTSNWYQGVVLNKGEDDGVRVEMGVVTPAGVVGKVVKTAGSTSVVLLMTDPNVALLGLVQRTREEGIVQGAAPSHVRMKYLSPPASVEQGDVVVTSGLTGGFPRGVLIGEVVRVEERVGDLFLTADIVPVVNFRQLEEVLIVTSPRSSEAMFSMDEALASQKNENPAR